MVTPKNSFAGPAPHVGDLATLHYPADNYPYIVTAVSANGAKVTLAELAPAAATPARFAGPYPVWDCDGDPARPTGHVVNAYRNNFGYAVGRSTPISFGRARYYRDYSD